VPERPTAIKRLDALFSAAMIAHEAIFEMRRELIASDRGGAVPVFNNDDPNVDQEEVEYELIVIGNAIAGKR
jgi:hypothetical protein